MNRRNFLQNTAAISAASLLSGKGLAAEAIAHACPSLRQPGAQLFTVRNLLADDPAPVFAALGNIGIRRVQLAGLNGSADHASQLFGWTPAEFKAVLQRAGLAVRTAHIGGDWTNAGAYADLAHELELETLVLGAPGDFFKREAGTFNMVPATDLAQLDRLADRLNQAGESLKKLGLTFGYHNHAVEFVPVDGRVAFDYLMEKTDPDLVKIEFDIGWLGAAGVDPAAYLRRYADRVVICHMKDFDGRVKLPAGATFMQTIDMAIVEPGAGTNDFRAVLAAMDDIGIQHSYIEIDRSDDPLAAIDRGNQYLQSLQTC